MTMSTVEAVKWLRSGHYTENIMVQITNQAVLDESPASCAVSQWPLMCANSGILRVAQKDYVDGTDKYYGVIQRITGLGEQFGGLLMGAPPVGAGSFDILLDGSPMMLEAKDAPWTNSQIEVRTGPKGTAWADALEIYRGIVRDADIKKGGTLLTFRVDGLAYVLNELIYYDQFDEANSLIAGLVSFGYCARFPVASDGSKSGSDWLYQVSTWDGEDTNYRIWNGDSIDYNHAESGAEEVVMYNSSGWTLLGSTPDVPENLVWAAIKGYNNGGFLDHAGEILEKAISMGHIIIGGPFYDSLDSITIDSAAFSAYDIAADYETGMIIDMLDQTHTVSDTPDITVTGTQARWVDCFEKLVKGTGGLWSFSRDSQLQIHSLLAEPTATEVLAIATSDYNVDRSTYELVDTIDGVTLSHANAFPDGDSGLTSSLGVTGSYQGKEPKVVTMTSSVSLSAKFSTFANAIKDRFGERDMKLVGCLLAKTLSVGEIVKITDPNDPYLSGGKKGWVKSIDRGSAPFIEVRI